MIMVVRATRKEHAGREGDAGTCEGERQWRVRLHRLVPSTHGQQSVSESVSESVNE